ncbi:hypothetical protein OSB04_027991 [Centaurea solstitialis]|uniref:Replication factor A C-terminal domain-containing protein n=1 Tax=Centaurea solstitialis TaxID=347529 RepID=A0AA38SEV6_9ASTR|nr:hypothetical protein OSB04_027991 [Centaurea solstitialis]
MGFGYRFARDLRPNITDKWQVHVMVSRAWTAYNPITNRVVSFDMILSDEQTLLELSESGDYLRNKSEECNHGTSYTIDAVIIGVDMFNDWKFIQCRTCLKKAMYKLVIRVTNNQEEMLCVLFNEVVDLVGFTVDKLLIKGYVEQQTPTTISVFTEQQSPAKTHFRPPPPSLRPTFGHHHQLCLLQQQSPAKTHFRPPSPSPSSPATNSSNKLRHQSPSSPSNNLRQRPTSGHHHHLQDPLSATTTIFKTHFRPPPPSLTKTFLVEENWRVEVWSEESV